MTDQVHAQLRDHATRLGALEVWQSRVDARLEMLHEQTERHHGQLSRQLISLTEQVQAKSAAADVERGRREGSQRTHRIWISVVLGVASLLVALGVVGTHTGVVAATPANKTPEVQARERVLT